MFDWGEESLTELINAYNDLFQTHFSILEMIYDECVFADISTPDSDEYIFDFGIYISQYNAKRYIEATVS